MSAPTYPILETKNVNQEVMPSGMVMLPISRTDGKKGKSGLCIVTPEISDNVLQLVMGNPIGKAWLIDCMNGVRSKIASDLNKAGKIIGSANLGIDALLERMKVENDSVRMTKESVGAWFDADLKGLIEDKIKIKLLGIAQDKLDKLTGAYREKFQSLCGRDVSMSNEVKAQLLVALELLGGDGDGDDVYDNAICNKLIEKLSEVKEATEILAAL